MNVMSMINGSSSLPIGSGEAKGVEFEAESVSFAPLLAALQQQVQTNAPSVELKGKESDVSTDEVHVLPQIPLKDQSEEVQALQDAASWVNPSMPDNAQTLAAASAVGVDPGFSTAADVDWSNEAIVAGNHSLNVSPEKSLPIRENSGVHSSILNDVKRASSVDRQNGEGRFVLPEGKEREPVQYENATTRDGMATMTKVDHTAVITAAESSPLVSYADTTHHANVIPVNQAVDIIKPPAQIPVVSLPQTTGTADWETSLGTQIAYFNREGFQNAELCLHPEELGAVHISMRINNEQMQIHFIAESAQARNALENALPQLRQSLAETGINLGHSSVGSEGQNNTFNMGQEEQRKAENDFSDSNLSDRTVGEESEYPDVKSIPIKYVSGINTFA